jgi:hypothetical protein
MKYRRKLGSPICNSNNLLLVKYLGKYKSSSPSFGTTLIEEWLRVGSLIFEDERDFMFDSVSSILNDVKAPKTSWMY